MILIVLHFFGCLWWAGQRPSLVYHKVDEENHRQGGELSSLVMASNGREGTTFDGIEKLW